MENLILPAKTRTIFGKKTKYLREQKKIPAIIYGHGQKSQPLEVDYLKFQKIYEKAGESSLIDLQIDDKNPIKVLIQDVQFSSLSNQFIHIDFHQVKMTEKITTEVPLKFTGESLAVKEMGGVLVKNIDKIKIECLPNDLIHELEVDISKIKTFDDIIHIADINIPGALTVLHKPEETVVSVEAPRTEEELRALEEGKEKEAEEKVTEKEEEEEGKEKEAEEAAELVEESSKKQNK